MDLSTRLVVGRICTPTQAKWPSSLIDFYSELARRVPMVNWEFVGCPLELQPVLFEACRQRAVFHPAGWTARAHLLRWDVLLYHHPTLTETFGRTAAEAMRASCVPVVDARGGFLEQVNSDSGWVCNTIDDFAGALEQLENPSLRNRMAASARHTADHTFSLTAIRQRLLRLWRQAG